MKVEKLSPFTIFLIVLVASIAIGAGVVVYFETPHSGKYSGPGVPITKQYTETVGVNDSYVAIPVKINSTSSFWLNETVTSADIGGAGYSTTGFMVGLMTQSDYNNFSANISMDFVAYNANSLNFNYFGSGEGTYYVIYINELNVSSTVTTVISVTVQ